MRHRNKTSLAASMASLLISLTIIFDLALWAEVTLRAAAIGIIGGLLAIAWRWYTNKDINPAA